MTQAGNERVSVQLTRENALGLREIFQYGLKTGPDDDTEGPRAHTVLAFNIPAEVLQDSEMTFGDFLDRAEESQRSLYCQMLALVCLIATCPHTGHASCLANNADRRGIADSDETHTFSYMGRSYNCAKMCIEELIGEDDQSTCGYRIWLFIYDPNLKPGAILDEIASVNYNTRNATSGARSNIPRKYLAASQNNNREPVLKCTCNIASSHDYTTVMERFLNSAVQSVSGSRGYNSPSVDVVGELTDLLNNLYQNGRRSSLMSVAELESSWSSPNSIKFIMSPLVAFSTHLGSTRPAQRNIWNYFRRPSDADFQAAQEAQNLDHNGAITAQSGIAEGLRQDDMGDDGDEDLVGDDEEDDELAAIGGAGHLAHENSDDLMDDEDVVGNSGNSSSISEAVRMRATSDPSLFTGFPDANAVSHIPKEYAGLRMANVPLHRILRNARLDDMGVHSENYRNETVRMKLDVPESFFTTTCSPEEFIERAEQIYDNYVQTMRLRPCIEHMVRMEQAELRFGKETISNMANDQRDRISVLRKIYKCKLLSTLNMKLMSTLPNLKRNIKGERRVFYEMVVIRPVTDNRLSFPPRDGEEASFNDEDEFADGQNITIEVPLPEEIHNGLSRNELEEFGRHDHAVAHRLKNNYSLSVLKSRFASRGTDPYDKDESGNLFIDELAKYRLDTTSNTWKLLMEGTNLTDAIKQMRDEYKRRSPALPKLPTHTYSVMNLSSLQNNYLRPIEIFNRLFRGATTQVPLALAYTATHSAPRYTYDMAANEIYWGDGGVGKTYVFQATSAMAPEGMTVPFDHPTPKSMTTIKGSLSFTDRANIMQEAKNSYIGKDNKYTGPDAGESEENTLVKAFLDSRRLSTIAYAKSENSNERLAVKENVRLMGVMLLASNSLQPTIHSPIMQRYLNITIPYSKREGFDKNAQAHPTSAEVDQDELAAHSSKSHLYGFLVAVVEKMIMTFAMEEPSLDGADYLVRGILKEYETISPSMKQNDTARNRTKLFALIRTKTIEDAIHTVLCSRYGREKLIPHLLTETDENGREVDVAFCPEFFQEVQKAMFASMDTVVYCMSMFSFLWEPKDKIDILTIIIDRANNSPYKEGRRLHHLSTKFHEVPENKKLLRPRWSNIRHGMRRFFNRRMVEIREQCGDNMELFEEHRKRLIEQYPDLIAVCSLDANGKARTRRTHNADDRGIADDEETQADADGHAGNGGFGGFGGFGGGRTSFRRDDSTQIDSTYVVYSAKTLAQICDRLASESPGTKKPSTREVRRVILELSKTYEYHHASVLMSESEYTAYKRRKRLAERELARENSEQFDEMDEDIPDAVPFSPEEVGANYELSSQEDEEIVSDAEDDSDHSLEEGDNNGDDVSSSVNLAEFAGAERLAPRAASARINNTIMHGDNTFPFWPVPERTSADDLRNAYNGESFYWVVDKSTKSLESRPIAFTQNIERPYKEMRLYVMVEAFARFKREGGLEKAIASFLSTSNLVPHPSSETGDTRDMLLCKNYTHHHHDGSEESMPQYHQTLTLHRNMNRQMVFPFEQAGTAASSIVLNQGTSIERRANFGSSADAQLGIFFNDNEPLNAWLAQLHWRRCMIKPADDMTIEEDSLRYTPEAATAYEYELAKRMYQQDSSRFICKYPEDSVKIELQRRRCKQQLDQIASGAIAGGSNIETVRLLKEAGLATSAHDLTVIEHLNKSASRIGNCFVDRNNLKLVCAPNANQMQKLRVDRANTEMLSHSTSTEYTSTLREIGRIDDPMNRCLHVSSHTINQSRLQKDFQQNIDSFLEKMQSSGAQRRIEAPRPTRVVRQSPSNRASSESRRHRKRSRAKSSQSRSVAPRRQNRSASRNVIY